MQPMLNRILALVINIVSAHTISYASRYIHDKVTWSNATNICRLASPAISFQPDVEFINVSSILFEDNKKVEDYTWIGYVRDYEYFEYQGCVTNESLQNNIRATRTVNFKKEIYLCRSACETEYFAIGGLVSCHCLNNTPVLSSNDWTKCNIKCGSFTCGPNDGTYMAVYKLTEYGHEKEPIRNECLSMNKTGGQIFKDCSDTSGIAGIVCPDYSGSQTSYYVHTTGGNWSDAITKCSPNATSQATAQEAIALALALAKETTAWKHTFWTPTVRTRTIQKVADWTMVDSHWTLYGFIDRVGKLFFTSNTTVMYEAMCEEAETTTGNSMTTTTTTTTPDIGDNTSARFTAETTTGHSMTTTTTTTTPDIGDNTSARFTGMYVGFGVGAAGLLAIIAMAVVCLARRYRYAGGTSQSKESTDNVVAYSKNAGDNPSDGYDTIATQQAKDFPFAKSDDETYDVHICGQACPSRRETTDNVYNTGVELASDNIYDHTDTTTTTNATTTDQYDTYGHADHSVPNKAGEDLYNHI